MLRITWQSCSVSHSKIPTNCSSAVCCERDFAMANLSTQVLPFEWCRLIIQNIASGEGDIE